MVAEHTLAADQSARCALTRTCHCHTATHQAVSRLSSCQQAGRMLLAVLSRLLAPHFTAGTSGRNPQNIPLPSFSTKSTRPFASTRMPSTDLISLTAVCGTTHHDQDTDKLCKEHSPPQAHSCQLCPVLPGRPQATSKTGHTKPPCDCV